MMKAAARLREGEAVLHSGPDTPVTVAKKRGFRALQKRPNLRVPRRILKKEDVAVKRFLSHDGRGQVYNLVIAVLSAKDQHDAVPQRSVPRRLEVCTIYGDDLRRRAVTRARRGDQFSTSAVLGELLRYVEDKPSTALQTTGHHAESVWRNCISA